MSSSLWRLKTVPRTGLSLSRSTFRQSGCTHIALIGRRGLSSEVEEEYMMDVSNLPARWNKLAGDAQQDIINYLKVKQEFAWTYLTQDEKKAIYYISYGEWGPRDEKSMGIPDLVFKIMSSSILLGVAGFTLLTYARDQSKHDE